MDWNSRSSTVSGNAAANERGLASLPGREDEFKTVSRARSSTQRARQQAPACDGGTAAAGADRARHREVYVKNISYAAGQAKSLGDVTVVIEPSTRVTSRASSSIARTRRMRSAGDGRRQREGTDGFLHCQIVEGDLVRTYEKFQAGVGHTQIAGRTGQA